jgi:MFS family permease
MWGIHQAAFMSVCKFIFGVTIAATPLLGALNDRTRLRFGRRRAWFFGGAVLIILGICCTALASVWRNSGMFFVSLTIWLFGEAACDSSTEALVPDLVSREDYSTAGGYKSGLFSLGGIFGYLCIIAFGFALRLPFYWMYLAFLFCILLTAPFVFKYTAPTETEVVQLETEASEETPMLQTLWNSYIYPLQGPDSLNFCKALVASSFYCAGASSILFILLVCRDIIRPTTSEGVQLHFACVSLIFCFFALIGAFFAQYIEDSITRLRYGKIIGTLYGASELLIPACAHFSSPTLPLYVVSAFKGVLYGSILSCFFSLQWDCLPAKLKEPDSSGHDHVAVAMGVAQVGRSLGAGIGNAIFGLILQFSFSDASLEANAEVFHYPLSSYYAMFSAAAISTWIGTILLQTIRLEGEST